MEKTIQDEICERISKILDGLPRINNKIESLNNRIIRGGITAKEMTELLRERSILIEKRRVMEKDAKELYRIKLEDTHEVEIISGIANQQLI